MGHINQIFYRQGLHLLYLTLLIAVYLLLGQFESVRTGSALRLSTTTWYWMAAIVAIIHQCWVWVCWRLELYGSKLTAFFGRFAFGLYAIIFAFFGISRVVAVFALAISNSNTINADPLMMKILSGILLIPAIYLFYSVARYFGFRRALGIDHFVPSYRSLPFVREGIFRFTPNGMYIFGFLLLWALAFWFSSKAAMIAAAFNHIYIWVHYYCTELPDIREMYGSGQSV